MVGLFKRKPMEFCLVSFLVTMIVIVAGFPT